MGGVVAGATGAGACGGGRASGSCARVVRSFWYPRVWRGRCRSPRRARCTGVGRDPPGHGRRRHVQRARSRRRGRRRRLACRRRGIRCPGRRACAGGGRRSERARVGVGARCARRRRCTTRRGDLRRHGRRRLQAHRDGLVPIGNGLGPERHVSRGLGGDHERRPGARPAQAAVGDQDAVDPERDLRALRIDREGDRHLVGQLRRRGRRRLGGGTETATSPAPARLDEPARTPTTIPVTTIAAPRQATASARIARRRDRGAGT